MLLAILIYSTKPSFTYASSKLGLASKPLRAAFIASNCRIKVISLQTANLLLCRKRSMKCFCWPFLFHFRSPYVGRFRVCFSFCCVCIQVPYTLAVRKRLIMANRILGQNKSAMEKSQLEYFGSNKPRVILNVFLNRIRGTELWHWLKPGWNMICILISNVALFKLFRRK